MATAKKEKKPLKTGASSGHITNPKQSVLETFDIYGCHPVDGQKGNLSIQSILDICGIFKSKQTKEPQCTIKLFTDAFVAIS
jgi:hypothetical protein